MKKRSTKFQPGRSGNPAGRPVGSKNKLSEEEKPRFVINAKPLTTLEWLHEHGLDVIESSETVMLENDQ